jgi:methylmalonyl-CoA mutase N-terminal domain/subunit
MNRERKTVSGIPLKAYYTQADFSGTTEARDHELPGRDHFTRGIFEEGYRVSPWIESLACGYSLPEETNERAKYLASVGQKGFQGRASINLVFDRPTFCGLDSDHPLAENEVGNIGVIIDCLDDMERLFKDFPLDNLNVGLIVDRSGPFIMAMYVALADRLGVPRDKLRGIVTNNPLTDMFCSKTPMFPADASMRLMVDCLKFCSEEVPKFNACRINAYNTRELGADAIQEVGFNLAIARAVVRRGIAQGMVADEVARRINYQFSQGDDFFEDICKVRAARRIWSRMLFDEFGVKDPNAARLKIHTQTAGSALTAQEPLNNIARIAIHVLQGALSGTQSMHIDSYDEALGIPTEEAARIAIKTSKIVAHETGVCNVADPLGGSYFVESLTDEIEKRVLAVMQEVEQVGGVVTALEEGYFEQEIANTSYLRNRDFEAGRVVKVGVNAYREATSTPFGEVVFRPDDGKSALAVERVKKLRAERDQVAARRCIEAIKTAVRTDAPVMPRYIDAAKANVTLGEMVSAVEEIVGRYQYRPITANVA